ncbi:hypothetical protein lerEdw1_013013 [Lerista edwardsae]|nr:hypothetical protein lerEdw1_013013 [Lerista edwardsae]
MVESPDEQSIMTYVAQFLEHFPELEGEDFSDPDKESPGETAYAHVKDAAGGEKQDKILILNENGEHVYLDRNQVPPFRIHPVGSPLDHKEIHLHLANEGLYDNRHQPPSDHSEAFTGNPQRPRSLPISEPLGFQSGSGAGILANDVNKGNGLGTSDAVTPNENPSPTCPVYRMHSVGPVDSSGDESEELNVQRPTSEAQESLEQKSGSFPRTSQAPKNMPEHLTEETVPPVSSPREEEKAHQYVLQMLQDEISKLPENDNAEKQASEVKEMHSAHQEMNGSHVKSNPEASCLPECLSLPIRNTPKSLDMTNEDGSTAEPALSSPKVSVIPHDLFYYPHYDVPISEVLDAFATPDPDPSLSENNKICAELIVNCLTENKSFALGSEDGVPESGQRAKEEVLPKDDKGPGKRKKDTCRQTKSSLNNRGVTVVPKSPTPALPTPKGPTHADVPMIVVNQFDIGAAEERKPSEERSKRKEKRKNKIVSQGESTQSSKAGPTRLLDKLEEEYIDHQGFSRVSQSEPNVFQRNTPDPVQKECGTVDEQRSTTTNESPSPSVRKRKEPEKKEAPERVISHSSTSRTDQPELFYFIVFLWVLVYCLLLLPQLVSS